MFKSVEVDVAKLLEELHEAGCVIISKKEDIDLESKKFVKTLELLVPKKGNGDGVNKIKLSDISLEKSYDKCIYYTSDKYTYVSHLVAVNLIRLAEYDQNENIYNLIPDPQSNAMPGATQKDLVDVLSIDRNEKPTMDELIEASQIQAFDALSDTVNETNSKGYIALFIAWVLNFLGRNSATVKETEESIDTESHPMSIEDQDSIVYPEVESDLYDELDLVKEQE